MVTLYHIVKCMRTYIFVFFSHHTGRFFTFIHCRDQQIVIDCIDCKIDYIDYIGCIDYIGYINCIDCIDYIDCSDCIDSLGS